MLKRMRLLFVFGEDRVGRVGASGFPKHHIHHGRRVPSIFLVPLGWRQYMPTRFFEYLIRKTYGWLFFYLIGFIESRSSDFGENSPG